MVYRKMRAVYQCDEQGESAGSARGRLSCYVVKSRREMVVLGRTVEEKLFGKFG